ncbi:type II CAAX endopeptidase family protein [Streptomyces sp. Qhu-G9]|uniref:CPBP family intramembrane glutamic endopeptidase n=1 Tax=Streptomyces sp. Qhu-G9 TaxID=3452799 RepID=UPI0022AC6C51|nr:type II CAAX endopeptidase family protein [Streptomyces aurantiacus]WAU83357.1 type II CAAX endopeptidase family protein [Streptomyces aurantiacus]
MADERVPPAAGHGSRPPMPWRVLTVFAAAVGLWWFVFHGAPISRSYDRPTHAARALLTTALVVPAVLAAWRLMDRRPWADLGLPAPRVAGRQLLLGAACWMLPSSAGIGLCLWLGWAEVASRASVAEMAGVAALFVLLVFLYEALPEELVFRGYLQRNLLTVLPPWQAVVGQAVLFTLFGFLLGVAPTPDRLFVFFTFALVLGVFRVATGDIAAGVGFHLGFQTVAQLFDGEGAVFEVSGAAVFGVVALGGLPFTVGWTVMVHLYRDRLDWHTPQP